MLFFPHGRIKKQDTEFEAVDTEGDSFISPDLIPGRGHVGRPVDIVKDKDRLIRGKWGALLKVIDSGSTIMIAVEINDIHFIECFQSLRQGFGKIAGQYVGITQLKTKQVVPRCLGTIRASLQSDIPRFSDGIVQVQGADPQGCTDFHQGGRLPPACHSEQETALFGRGGSTLQDGLAGARTGFSGAHILMGMLVMIPPQHPPQPLDILEKIIITVVLQYFNCPFKRQRGMEAVFCFSLTVKI